MYVLLIEDLCLVYALRIFVDYAIFTLSPESVLLIRVQMLSVVRDWKSIVDVESIVDICLYIYN